MHKIVVNLILYKNKNNNFHICFENGCKKCIKGRTIEKAYVRVFSKKINLLGKSLLYVKNQSVFWILDDESYFNLSHSTINGNDTFYTSNIDVTPGEVKYTEVAKFELKLLVWVCMSELQHQSSVKVVWL